MGLFPELNAPGKACGCSSRICVMALGFPCCAGGLSPTAASSNCLQAGVKLLQLGTGWGLSSGLAGKPTLTH